jgi:ectoine hydroxylase-related dioxygenase (phytanoyl-CoA dioxygenase family)
MSFKKALEDYSRNGFAIIPNFLSDEEISELKSECARLVERFDPNEHRITNVGNARNIILDDYLVSSVDKISFLFEKDAIGSDGNLKVDKSQALNKIAHALHWWSPVFKKLTFSQKVKSLVREVGFVDPKVIQGMYIFKNPRIGGEFYPHQDSTYLYTTPEIKVMGLWFALDDANEENGCLDFIPGSHREGLKKRWYRNPNIKNNMLIEGESPEEWFDEKKYVPAAVKKGSCVLIHGLVVHKSAPNKSDKGRPIYTFHIYDQNGCEWSKENMLQPTARLPFPSLYNN